MSRIRTAPFATLALTAALATAAPVSALAGTEGAYIVSDLATLMRAPARRANVAPVSSAPQLLAMASASTQAMVVPLSLIHI